MLRAAFQLSGNLLHLARYTARRILWSIPGLRRRVRPYIRLSLPSGMALTGTQRGFGPFRFGPAGAGAWWRFDSLLTRIESDPWVEGVYFRMPTARFGLTEAQAIARRLDRLRVAGKRVICYLEQGMIRDYVLASAADTIVMAPPGRLYTFGLRLEMMFLPQALEKAGITAQFVNLGRFKTAAHRFTRQTATPAQLRMMGHLLHEMGDSVKERIATRRQLSADSASAIFDEAPLSARQARRRQLIDRMAYPDQIIEMLEGESECGRKVALHTPGQYVRSGPPVFRWKPLRGTRDTVAVMSLQGVIMHDGARPPARQVITPKPVIRAFRRIARDPRVKAVVLHIDSPGGSAIGSDIIWRQLRKLAEKKPVIAALGNVAASGGYYIAVGAHEIVAQPSSITGSIGVIAGKLSGGALLEKIGVRIEGVELGETAAFGSIAQAMGPRELENLSRDIRAFYRRFLHRVSVGRAMDLRRVHRLARGRVYSGRRAHRLGLVDHLGDLDQAIDLAFEKAGITRREDAVAFIDHRDHGLRRLLKARNDPGAAGAMAAEYVVPEALQAPAAIAHLLQHPTTLALMPLLTQSVR